MLNHSIAFVGFMGSGKTTLSSMVAKYFSIPLLSSDDEIEKQENKKISDIFREFGEEYFRDLEHKFLINNSTKDNIIFDLGGGAFIRDDNRYILKNNRIKTIFLDTSFDIICKRLENERECRPLLNNSCWKENARQLYNYRKNIYRKADICIDINTEEEANVIFQRILELLI